MFGFVPLFRHVDERGEQVIKVTLRPIRQFVKSKKDYIWVPPPLEMKEVTPEPAMIRPSRVSKRAPHLRSPGQDEFFSLSSNIIPDDSVQTEYDMPNLITNSNECLQMISMQEMENRKRELKEQINFMKSQSGGASLPTNHADTSPKSWDTFFEVFEEMLEQRKELKKIREAEKRVLEKISGMEAVARKFMHETEQPDMSVNT